MYLFIGQYCALHQSIQVLWHFQGQLLQHRKFVIRFALLLTILLHFYIFFCEMLGSVVNDCYFKFMLHLVDIVLSPFFALRLEFFKLVKLDLVFTSKDKLLLDIILFSESIKPQPTPNKSNIANQRKIIYFLIL